jgi:hypothetical protein
MKPGIKLLFRRYYKKSGEGIRNFLIVSKPFFQKESFTKETSILITLYVIKRNLFWIKPFSKRFDVSILVFVDCLCNLEEDSPFKDWGYNGFNPCFCRPPLQHTGKQRSV